MYCRDWTVVHRKYAKAAQVVTYCFVCALTRVQMPRPEAAVDAQQLPQREFQIDGDNADSTDRPVSILSTTVSTNAMSQSSADGPQSTDVTQELQNEADQIILGLPL